MALLKRHQIAGFIVRFAIDPASMEDADPHEGESAKRGLMGASPLAVALIEGFGPEGARDCLANPLDEGLSLEGRAGEAPVDPALVATALGNGGDAYVLLQGSRVWESLSTFAEGDEQPRSEGWTSTGQRVKELVVRELGGERCNLCIEAFDGSVDGTELRKWWSRRAAAEDR